LVSPDSVPSTIIVLVEAFADEDMEYAVLQPSLTEVYVPAVSQSGYTVFPPAELGSGRNGIRAAEAAIGERIESLRQIGKAMFPIQQVSAGGTSERWYMSVFSLVPVHQNTDNTSALIRGQFYNDPMTLIEMCYAASTGSRRVVMYNLGGSSYLLMAGVKQLSGISDILYGLAGGTGPSECRQIVNWAVEGIADFIIPPFIRTAGMANAARICGNGMTSGIVNGGVSTLLQILSPQNKDLTYSQINLPNIARPAGDDWNCYHWVSTPTMVLRTTS
jgi:hypothetical protein